MTTPLPLPSPLAPWRRPRAEGPGRRPTADRQLWRLALAAAQAPGLRLRHALFGHLVYGKLRAATGGRVQYAVSGGAPLGERLGHFFRGCGMTVLEGYGLTEASGAATVNRPGRCKIGTVGHPLAGVTARIAGDGEILLRGPNVFPGYWHDQAARGHRNAMYCTLTRLDDDHTGL